MFCFIGLISKHYPNAFSPGGKVVEKGRIVEVHHQLCHPRLMLNSLQAGWNRVEVAITEN